MKEPEEIWETRVVLFAPWSDKYVAQYKISKHGFWRNFKNPFCLDYTSSEHDDVNQPFLGDFEKCVNHAKEFTSYAQYKEHRQKQIDEFNKEHSAKREKEKERENKTWHSK